MRQYNVSIDIDGTITDHHGPWFDFYDSRTGICHAEYRVGAGQGWVSEHPTISHWGQFEEICSTCYEAVLKDENVASRMTLYPGVKVSLAYLNKDAKLYVITSRETDVEAITIAWLDAMGILQYFEEVVFDKNKAQYCAEHGIDVIVDDSPRELRSFEHTKAIAFDRPYNKGIMLPRAYDWSFTEDGVVPTVLKVLNEDG